MGPQMGPPMGPQMGPPMGPQMGPPMGPPMGSPFGPHFGPPIGPLMGSPFGPPFGQYMCPPMYPFMSMYSDPYIEQSTRQFMNQQIPQNIVQTCPNDDFENDDISQIVTNEPKEEHIETTTPPEPLEEHNKAITIPEPPKEDQIEATTIQAPVEVKISQPIVTTIQEPIMISQINKHAISNINKLSKIIENNNETIKDFECKKNEIKQKTQRLEDTKKQLDISHKLYEECNDDIYINDIIKMSNYVQKLDKKIESLNDIISELYAKTIMDKDEMKTILKEIIIPIRGPITHDMYSPLLNYHSSVYCDSDINFLIHTLIHLFIDDNFNGFVKRLYDCLVVRFIRLHHHCFENSKKTEYEDDEEEKEISTQRTHIDIINNLYNLYLFMTGYNSEGISNFKSERQQYLSTKKLNIQSVIKSMDDLIIIQKQQVTPRSFVDFYALNIPIKYFNNHYYVNDKKIEIENGIDKINTTIKQIYLMNNPNPINNKTDDADEIYPDFIFLYKNNISVIEYKHILANIDKTHQLKYFKYKTKYLNLLHNKK
jgi:hypothetical protein